MTPEIAGAVATYTMQRCRTRQRGGRESFPGTGDTPPITYISRLSPLSGWQEKCQERGPLAGKFAAHPRRPGSQRRFPGAEFDIRVGACASPGLHRCDRFLRICAPLRCQSICRGTLFPTAARCPSRLHRHVAKLARHAEYEPMPDLPPRMNHASAPRLCPA